MKRLLIALVAFIGLAALATAAVLWLDRAPALQPGPAFQPTAEQIERGRQLALAGNCAGCHTARGGAAYAGGRGIPTPFGWVWAGNLTPDATTGLGAWNAAEFWRALHHGVGRDGRRLTPAFPYTEFTRVTRADSDALFAYLRSLPPVASQAQPHALRWPYGTPVALAAWRVLYFREGEYRPDPNRSLQWNRGAYLVNGLAHCGACHGARNALGGPSGTPLSGGSLPQQHWLAPSLTRADEAGVADWPEADIVALLRDGRAPRGWASGPMAEVVARSTQHLPAADLAAIAHYLKALPAEPPAAPATFEPAPQRAAQGGKLYADHCASCHGKQGEGGVNAAGQTVVPRLAGNRLITQEPAMNLVRTIALGGFGAATAAHPRPYGMPPYAHVLNDAEISAVATFLRSAWGARAAPVSDIDVARWRGGSVH